MAVKIYILAFCIMAACSVAGSPKISEERYASIFKVEVSQVYKVGWYIEVQLCFMVIIHVFGYPLRAPIYPWIPSFHPHYALGSPILSTFSPTWGSKPNGYSVSTGMIVIRDFMHCGDLLRLYSITTREIDEH
jgi:hypothetical protein